MSATTLETLTGSYTIDASHSQIGFGARHAMVTKVRGQFKEFSGTGFYDAENPSNSKLNVVIKVDSIDTRNSDRDAHLRSNDFFAMDQFPEITFASTAFEKVNEETFKVTGDLTVRGVTKSISFDLGFTGGAIDPWGNQRIGFEGSTTINRKEFGVNWNAALEAGGVLVSEKVTLEFEISAVRDGAAA